MLEERKLEMSVDLSVIEHLGMNLYSNTPAVLAELVANAWDADAQNVWITISDDRKSISVRDDGVGMSRDQVIDQYLSVGYRRREKNNPLTSQFKRKPMGRKGIGKLSCFSIADTVIVHTSQASQKTAFRMNTVDIKESLQTYKKNSYEPTPITEWHCEVPDSGTSVTLKDLKRNVTQTSVNHLKQRLARRFTVLGETHDFKMFVNGDAVTIDDRSYLKSIEFLWEYGDGASQFFTTDVSTSIKERVDRSEAVRRTLKENGNSISIRGWLGSVRNPSQLKDEGGQNLNRIAIFMRGKMAQEDILADFGEKRLFSDYLIGEIYCDDLDDDSADDIATSSRQDLKLDDPRFVLLREAIRKELSHIQSKWSSLRTEAGTKRLIQSVPAVEEWLDSLKGETKKRARQWIGRLNVIRTDQDDARRELLKGSILSFESYRRKEQLDFLDQVEDESIETLLSVFDDIDDLQLSYYGQIVKLRLGVLRTLREKLDANDYEKTLQEHIYNHLWLIDPSWERVPGTETEERGLKAMLDVDTKGLSNEEKYARIDIGYRTATGRHVIVELKRKSVAVSIYDLTRQIGTYRSAAQKLIAKSPYATWPLEIICVVGEPPPQWHDGPSGREDCKRQLAAFDARLVFYDELLSNAHRAYKDYLESHKKIDRLWPIFEAIENFVPTQDS